MEGPTDRIRTNPIRMVLLMAALALLIVYVTVSVTTGDLTWFLKGFRTMPARMVVYHHEGKRTELQPGDPGFAELASAVQACLAEGAERPSGIGFSDASLLDAYSQYVSLEVFFDRPVKLHAWFDTGAPTQMLFPITGRHSELSLVLLGNNGKYLASPPSLKTTEPIRHALQALGYLEDQSNSISLWIMLAGMLAADLNPSWRDLA
jgi:hypothetical protein